MVIKNPQPLKGSKNMKKVLFILLSVSQMLNVASQQRIVVDVNGSGDFKTIQEAINSLPETSAAARTIFYSERSLQRKTFC